MGTGQFTTQKSALSWDDIQVFLTIARSGTLSAAAPMLSLSQPTLGRRLKALEGLVGSPLFIRTSDGLRLTTDGRSILSDAETMEQSALALQRRLTSDSKELTGLLRVASRQWIMHHLLGVSLSTFARYNPWLTLAFVQDRRLLDLTFRDADLVFRCTLSGHQAFADPNTVQRCITRVGFDLFASSDYLAEHGGWPTEGGGDGHRLIIDDPSSSDQDPQELWLLKQFPKAHVILHCDCCNTQALACVQGTGLALLPRLIGKSHLLERRDNEIKAPDGALWLGYHRDLRELQRLRALIQYVVSSARKEC